MSSITGAIVPLPQKQGVASWPVQVDVGNMRQHRSSGKRKSGPPVEGRSYVLKALVPRRRLELLRAKAHHPLKMARLPISPPRQALRATTGEEAAPEVIMLLAD